MKVCWIVQCVRVMGVCGGGDCVFSESVKEEGMCERIAVTM